MIVWKGWGILVVPLAAICIGPLVGLAETLIGPGTGAIGAAVGLVLAGVLTYLLGTYLNKPVPGYHPQTGQPVMYRNGHSLFFVPVQFWGFIMLAGSVVALVAGALALM